MMAFLMCCFFFLLTCYHLFTYHGYLIQVQCICFPVFFPPALPPHYLCEQACHSRRESRSLAATPGSEAEVSPRVGAGLHFITFRTYRNCAQCLNLCQVCVHLG